MIQKLLLLSFIITSTLFSKEYMTQIKPYKSYEIKSEVAGIVKSVDFSKEAQFVNNKTLLVQLNAKDENIDLQAQQKLLQSQNEIIHIKEKNYKAKNRIKQLSQYDKNSEKLSFLESKKEHINTKKTIQTLKNDINKKSFYVDKKYIGKIAVNPSEYVNISDKVFDMYDISKLKITLYLTQKEIQDLDKHSVYINGKISDFKVYKTYKIKDSIKVSRYKVEFIKENQDINNYFFDEVVKVELK